MCAAYICSTRILTKVTCLKFIVCKLFNGWWFGTCFIFPYIPLDFHIFQRVSNHQPVLIEHENSSAIHSHPNRNPSAVPSHGLLVHMFYVFAGEAREAGVDGNVISEAEEILKVEAVANQGLSGTAASVLRKVLKSRYVSIVYVE